MQTALRFPAFRFPARRLQPRGQDPRREFVFLERRFTPRTVFMDIGSPDCALALQAASYVERVYAVDVSGHFVRNVLVPCNLRLVLCDGVRLPLPEAGVDVAYSGGFIDQLHPDDAHEHLRAVLRSLVPGGEYVCKTTSFKNLRRGMLAAGFSAVACHAGALRVPWSLVSLVPQNLLRIVGNR